MNGRSWSIRCAGVSRDVVEAEAARWVAAVSSDDEITIAYAAGPPAIAELEAPGASVPAIEVATRLGGLAWFRREAMTDEQIDVRALYIEGALVFAVRLCELLDCDELEIGPGLVDDLEPTLADLMEPGAWVMRVAAERFGDDFARISRLHGIRADEHRTIAGTGPARDPDDRAEPADDDLPF